MPTDRLLVTLLRNLQTHTDRQDTPRLLSTAASLLTTLSNPLNLTLLTSQLLSSPAIWARPNGLRLCLRFLGVFQSASLTILRAEDERHEAKVQKIPLQQHPGQPVIGGNLSRDEWVKAIVKGADDRSPRWRHLLVISGLLIGYAGEEREGLPRHLRNTLETALVRATNLALEDVGVADEMAAHCISLVLNYSFELLSDLERSRLNHDRLLPVLIGSAFFSQEGYRSAYFLGPIDMDVLQTGTASFTWSDHSPSSQRTSAMLSSPLVATMGPLARLIAHTIEHVSASWLIITALADLAGFAKALDQQWRQNKLSEVDASEERVYCDEHTLTKTLPVLWKLLRSALFAVVIVLRGAMGRVLNDASLAADDTAPDLATTTLQTLRSLSFISTRLNASTFSQHTFVLLTTLDILTAYPSATSSFLASIHPTPTSPPLFPATPDIPSHPLDRTHVLFFLNTAEHLTFHLPPDALTGLLRMAAPYLSITLTHPTLQPLFEAAHALTLAVFSAPAFSFSSSFVVGGASPSSPQSRVCLEPVDQQIKTYTTTLLTVFPSAITPRQFRLAFRTLVRLASPPNPLGTRDPDMAECLMEVLRGRAEFAMSSAAEGAEAGEKGVVMRNGSGEGGGAEEGMRPSTAPVLTLVDCLPVLEVGVLGYWLDVVAALAGRVAQGEMCRQRFWECISSGEMDVERSGVCVRWWGGGGLERAGWGIGAGGGGGEVVMSGALGGLPGGEDADGGESKL